MSEPVSALNHASYSQGYVTIKESGLIGMVTLRTALPEPALETALKTYCLCAVPKTRQILFSGEMRIAWMSPDELLICCAYHEADKLVNRLKETLGQTHSLIVNMSDARAAFDLYGTKADEIMAKLSPVDLSEKSFEVDEIRRTRLAQIPVAFWREGPEQIRVICFRSVAAYVFDILSFSARPGHEVFSESDN